MADDAAAQAAAAAAQAKEDAAMMRKAASDPTEIHVKLDAEFEAKNYLKVHQKLMEVFFLNPNIESGWRFTRVSYFLSIVASGQHEITYVAKAYETIKKCLEMEGGAEHPEVRKWAGIILGAHSENLDDKQKVAASEEIRQHLEAALVHKADDAELLHAMGMYCFQVAGIGWVQRTAAKVMFGKDLKSSYEEALIHFAKAKEVSGGKNPMGEPWFKNDFMIAQCLAKQKKKDVEGAKQLFQAILADERGAAGFEEDIAAFCKKKKISL